MIDIYKADKPTIGFLPLDLDYQLPDENEIIKYCHKNHIKREFTEENGPCWLITPVCGRFNPADWYDHKKVNNHWFNRYVSTKKELEFVNDIEKKFPNIKHMLNQLPYKELSIATLFLQISDVESHIDWFKDDNYDDPDEKSIENEPRRFNIQLSKHHYPSTFLSGTEKGEKYYANISQKTPGYCISEMYNWHGADLCGPDKITLFTTGLIDKEKRDQLINKSLLKYNKDAIIFNNGIRVQSLKIEE